MSKPKSKFSLVSFGNIGCVLDAFPPWVNTLKNKAHIPTDRHFIITIKTSNVTDGFEWELVDEKLEYLATCDIYRDGGSYGATWITNYGNRWELWLQVDYSFDEDEMKYNYLYNCNHSKLGSNTPVLKGGKDDDAVKEKIDQWLKGRPSVDRQSNEDLVGIYSRFQEMLYKMPSRKY
jgi:hypothetical protein